MTRNSLVMPYDSRCMQFFACSRSTSCSRPKEALAPLLHTHSSPDIGLPSANSDACVPPPLPRSIPPVAGTGQGSAGTLNTHRRLSNACVPAPPPHPAPCCKQVKAALAPLPSMPDWKRGGAAAGSAAVALPSFNSYPLAYVTAIGEYLMTLPQQVRPLCCCCTRA